MCKHKLHLAAIAVALLASARAGATSKQPAASSNQGDEEAADLAPGDQGAELADRRAARAYGLLPFALPPRLGDQLVTSHFWAGYEGGPRGAVGEAVVDGTITPYLALRVGASSSDLWGRPTAMLGARLRILREGAAPLDLGVGVVYQPQSIRGDGIVTGIVSLGKTVGRLSSQATFGYGQDPEGDDGLGVASLGGVFSVSERVHVGIQGRARAQLWSTDRKFANLEQPLMDFSVGPLFAYSLGAFDVMVHGGVAGLMLRAPPEIGGERARLQLGPVALLGLGVTL
jgi:hypothetical protein